MHEIITLQFGQRSNYLATHFWNTQESYFTYSSEEESLVDHDIHFRPGIGADGSETFTPRTIIYDLKGGFGSLKKINALYEIEEPVTPQGLWNGPTIVQRQNAITPNEYQQSLEAGLDPPRLTTRSVRYWSDFNRVFYHPRSIVQLNEYELGSSLMPFETWGVGEDLFNSLDKEHDLLDRDLRPFAEEADQLQGIQLLTGTDDAWGGFTARYIDRIRDEYGKTSICVWGGEENTHSAPREKRLIRLSNTARSFSEISSQASIFIPTIIPETSLPDYVIIDLHSRWHTSALLATALESVFLPSRLRNQQTGRETLDQFENALNINGNQHIAKLRLSVVKSPGHNGNHQEMQIDEDRRLSPHQKSPEAFDLKDDEHLSEYDIDFYPQENIDVRQRRKDKKIHTFGLMENFRIAKDENSRSDKIDTDAGFERARKRAAGLTVTHRRRTPLLFPIVDSFPEIFSGHNNSLAVNTSLSTDTAIAARLKTLKQIVGRTIGIDERESLSNTLGEMAEAYEEGWDSGSDEDDD